MTPKIDQITMGMQTAKVPSDFWITSDIEFPELEASRQIIQRNSQSVFNHSMQVINLLTIKNPVTLLGGLFHDLGKYYVQNTNNPLLSRFPGHAIESARIAKIRLTKWGATPYLIDRVARIVSTHMYDISNVTQEKTIRKFIADVGLDNIKNWFVLRIADSASYSQHGKCRKYLIDPFYEVVKNYLNKLPSRDSLLQLQSEPNIVIEGKECKNNDVFLSMEGDNN